MRKIAVRLSLIAVVAVTLLSTESCRGTRSNQDTDSRSVDQLTEGNESSKEREDVEVYYFHGSRRCVTCKAVESVTEQAIKELYGKTVIFRSVNLEESRDSDLVQKYKVNGQTLLVTKGKSSVNLTNYAFMNAKTDANRVKLKLKSTIDLMLKK